VKALVLNRIALVLTFVGIYVSGVLSLGAFFEKSIPCGQDNGCDIVAMHPSSHALGIPNAYIGLALYVVLAGLTYWRLANPAASRLSVVIGYSITALGTLASLLLTYVSLAIIHATCKWCLASTATMIALLVVHALLMQTEPNADVVPRPPNGIILPILVLASFIGLGVQSAQIENSRLLGQPKDLNVVDEVILPKDAHIYGDPSAPITIVEFGDLICPTCQNEYGKIKAYVNEHRGKIKYAFRHFPMLKLEGHEQALAAAFASEIASEQDRFWPFVDLMYSEVRYKMPDTGPILAIADALQMDRKKLLDRIIAANENDPAFKRLMRDIGDGSKIGVHATPTFIIMAKGVKPRAATIVDLYEHLQDKAYKKYLGSG
jgi:protein-disulfide isomerase